jgi:hypothetical protein
MRTIDELTPDEIRRLMRSMVSAGWDNTNADWYDLTNTTWDSIHGRLCRIINNLDESQLVDNDVVVVEYAVE